MSEDLQCVVSTERRYFIPPAALITALQRAGLPIPDNATVGIQENDGELRMLAPSESISVTFNEEREETVPLAPARKPRPKTETTPPETQAK